MKLKEIEKILRVHQKPLNCVKTRPDWPKLLGNQVSVIPNRVESREIARPANVVIRFGCIQVLVK